MRHFENINIDLLANSLERKAWRLAIWGKTKRVRCIGDFLFILYHQYKDINFKYKDYEDIDWIPEDINKEITRDYESWLTSVANFLFIIKDTCTSIDYERDYWKKDLEKYLNY